MYQEDDFLMLSGIQHFIYCKRQWALIHLEQQWAENGLTIDGDILHHHVHDHTITEKRGNLLLIRGLPVHSYSLGLSGVCDMVEFHRHKDGVSLANYEGKWLPFPIEYKKGKPKKHQADEAQLCAQAICLEEMFLCTIPEGALFYGENHRRQAVDFTNELRQLVKDTSQQMHQLYNRKHTPRVKQRPECRSCSIKDMCLPGLSDTQTVDDYIKESLEML